MQEIKRRPNTTNTMFICNTMECPNRDQIIDCVSKSIFFALSIHSNEQKRMCERAVDWRQSKRMEIFDERRFPLSEKKRNFKKLPKKEEIGKFVKFLFVKQELAPQVGIMAIHYIDQLINKTGLLITPMNWRRILLCALLVADKVWEEDIVCNKDFCCDVWSRLTVDDLNKLEREFLGALDFKLVVKSSVYAEYYFALRSIAGLSCFPADPLNKETLSTFQKGQVRRGARQAMGLPKRRRSKSEGGTDDKKIKSEIINEKEAVSLEELSQRMNGNSFC